MRNFETGMALSLAILVIPNVANAIDPAEEPYALPEPNVIMEADPPPPFTYWAPEGSTIRNHSTMDGIWIAEFGEQRDTYYFGDRCKASAFQAFVGSDLDSFPALHEDVHVRFSCTECAVTSDLGWARLNVVYDEETNLIEQISCG